MPECPDLAALDEPSSVVRHHIAACASCRIVIDLLDERKRSVEVRNHRDECARFEMLLAARDDGTIGGTAGALLEAHLRECAECQAVASTLPPASERREHSDLPAVATNTYALGREVARGGMGRILAAEDLRIGRPVALKELLGKAPALAARFEREARVTARLQHPGIVPIYEIGKWPDGTPFYAMRMVEGRTLREAIRERSSLDERLALLPVVIAAAEAVAFAHGKHVIHRDLTPNNILVGAYGDTVVIDWGLAKDLSVSTEGEEDVAAGPYRDEPVTDGPLTTTGAVIGTAAYMPPEQARGQVVDERADVYALGAILYHVLVGEAPYRASTSADIVHQVQAGPPTALHEAALGAPRDLTSIAEKAMSRDAASRYDTAAHFVDELRRFQTGRLVEAHAYSRSERLRRWIRSHRVAVIATAAALVAMSVAGAIGFAGVVTERDHAQQQEAVAVQQRGVAEAAKAKVEQINTSLMEEQGRQELLAGNTTRALAWLNEAYRGGDASPELRFLLGTAMRRMESVVQTIPCKSPSSADPPSLSFSPDGMRAMVACEDGIRIARVSDFKILTAIPGASGGAVWSHDNQRIASKWHDTMSLWDGTTGRQVFTIKAHVGSIRSILFTPDDRLLVTTGDDAKARIWDVSTGEVIRTIDAGSGKMNVVRGLLVPDGRTLVTITGDGVVKQWDVATGGSGSSFVLPSQPIGSGGFSPDGKRLATCHADGIARITDLASGRVVMSFAAHAIAGFGCHLTADARRLVTSGMDGAARVWDVETGRMQSSLELGGSVSEADISREGEHVATVSTDGVLRTWHATSGSLLASLDDPAGFGDPVAYGNDGRTLLVARSETTVLVLRDFDGGVQPVAIPTGTDAFAASPTAAQLALRDGSGAMSIVDSATLATLTHEPLREPVAWSEDGRRVAAGTSTGAIVLDAADGRVLARIPSTGLEALAFDEAGRRLLVASGSSQVWDIDRDQLELAIGMHSGTGSISPSGDVVVAWRDPRHVEIWNVGAHAVQARFEVDDDVLGTIGFMADGQHVLLGLNDPGTTMAPLPNLGRASSYELATGKRVFRLPQSFTTFLSPDRRRITSSGARRDVALYDATDGRVLSRVVLDADLLVSGTVAHDGLLLSPGLRHVDIRSWNDGRLLARTNGNVDGKFTQDGFSAGFTFGIADRGATSVALGKHPIIWRLPYERRSPDEIDRIVRDRVQWRIVDGRLAPVEARVHGRITRGGHPVSGAEVTIDQVGLTQSSRALSDADGHYAFERLPLRDYDVQVTSPDHAIRGRTRVTPDRADVTADIELDEQATISGRVVDEQGAPIAGVKVTAIDTSVEALSSATGEFTIRALRSGRFEVAAIETTDGKPTGYINVRAPGVPVELGSNTDAASGVTVVVRRVQTR